MFSIHYVGLEQDVITLMILNVVKQFGGNLYDKIAGCNIMGSTEENNIEGVQKYLFVEKWPVVYSLFRREK